MKNILFILCLYKLVEGALIPTPFITDPVVIQRAGRDTTEKYFERKLFKSPYGIAFTKLRNTSPQGEIVLSTDCGWHRLVYVYLEEDGRQAAKWIKAYAEFGSGVGQFDEPMGICIDTTIYNGMGNEYTIYIADKINNRVVKLKYKVAEEILQYAGTFGSGFYNPTDVACVAKDGGGAYVVIVEQGNHRLSLYETYSNGSSSLIQRYGELGPGIGRFSMPSGIAICKATDGGVYFIYVTDTGNNRVVCLRFQPGQGITWERVYKKLGDCRFLSVTASQYYCVYVTAFKENKIYVFTPGLTELLYTYGNSELLNGPKDVYIDWDRLGLTERWTAGTGIQYFKIIPEVREFYPDPAIFDATKDSVKINFKVYETKHYLTMGIPDAGVTLFEEQEFVPGSYSVWWDGRDSLGRVVLPGEYLIRISCQGEVIATTTVRVKGTRVAGVLSSDEHWTEDDEPYVLTGDVEIPGGGRLVIDPGVKVMPVGNYVLSTYTGYQTSNKLIAQGTALNPILFTPHRKLFSQPDPVLRGFWCGIKFSGSGEDDTLLLKYCIIEAAGRKIIY